LPAIRPPSQLHAHLGYWLRIVSNAVSQSFARKVEAEGVTVAEWVVLRFLFDAERIAPSRLAERMGVTKGAVSRLADRLVEKGFVERNANSEDRRAHMLVITLAGRKIGPRLAALAEEIDAEFFDALAPAERRRLESLLRKIVAARSLTDIPTE